jgi:hypothetical protein
MRVGGDVGMFVIVMRVAEVDGGGGGLVTMIAVWGEGSRRRGRRSVGIHGEPCDNRRSKRRRISDAEGESREVGKNKGCRQDVVCVKISGGRDLREALASRCSFLRIQGFGVVANNSHGIGDCCGWRMKDVIRLEGENLEEGLSTQ